MTDGPMTDDMQQPDAIGVGPLDPATERQVAIDLFNHVWRLLDVDPRTSEQDDAMVHAAHASRWHWGQVGGAEQRAVGEWQCSRVYAVLGRPVEALHHARRCLELSALEGVDPFVAASAHEALARAYAVAGDTESAIAERNAAYAIAVDLEDDDDRGVIESDLGTLPLP
jgi:hypothetical protein